MYDTDASKRVNEESIRIGLDRIKMHVQKPIPDQRRAMMIQIDTNYEHTTADFLSKPSRDFVKYSIETALLPIEEISSRYEFKRLNFFTLDTMMSDIPPDVQNTESNARFLKSIEKYLQSPAEIHAFMKGALHKQNTIKTPFPVNEVDLESQLTVAYLESTIEEVQNDDMEVDIEQKLIEVTVSKTLPSENHQVHARIQHSLKNHLKIDDVPVLEKYVHNLHLFLPKDEIRVEERRQQILLAASSTSSIDGETIDWISCSSTNIPRHKRDHMTPLCDNRLGKTDDVILDDDNQKFS